MSESKVNPETNELDFAELQFRELSKRIPQFEKELESMRRKHKAYGEIISASKPPAVEISNGATRPDSTRTLAEALKDPAFFPKSAEDNGFDRLTFNRMARLCVQTSETVTLHSIASYVTDRDAKLAAFPKLLERAASYLFQLTKAGELAVFDDTHRPRKYAKTDKFRPIELSPTISAANSQPADLA